MRPVANSGPTSRSRCNGSGPEHIPNPPLAHWIAVSDLRWFNPSQPQTLTSAVLLSYIRAFFLLIGMSANFELKLLAYDVGQLIGVGDLAADLITLIALGAMVAGGLGTSSERKWGHRSLAGAAVYTAIATVWLIIRLGQIPQAGLLIGLMFDIVLVVLVFHPMSREYRRIWFR